MHKQDTPISGLTLWHLPIHRDGRGWFKENWRHESMAFEGLPDFQPVQQNVSFNEAIGTTRGIHAEPWDKYVSVAAGRVFAVWVDLRRGASFGAVFTLEMDPSTAVFVPRGVGNAYQTLESGSVYTYLVNEHYVPQREYIAVNLADPTLGIEWPIDLARASVSAKDRSNPALSEVEPIPPRKILVVGANGQLGKSIRQTYADVADVEYATRFDLNLLSPGLEEARPWQQYDAIINAAAFTAVDAAETPEGRRSAWETNVGGVVKLARIASTHRITLVHISSDYVFDGDTTRPYLEEDPVCPISVYGQTKAAGEEIVSTTPRHYIIRTSWLIGDGRNFVSTMLNFANQGSAPAVVNDQRGRLTFTSELSHAIRHLLDSRAPFGIYNVTGGGAVKSWADIARVVFEQAGQDANAVRGVSTAQYHAGAGRPVAPRPANRSSPGAWCTTSSCDSSR